MIILVITAVMSFVLAFYGSAVGLVLGHLRLPLLLHALGSPAAAAATNLAISGLGALSGTVKHARAGRVSWPLVLLMGVPSAIGAVAGLHLLGRLPGGWGRLVIGLALMLTAWKMLRPGEASASEAPRLPRSLLLASEALLGLVLGLLAGVVGLMLGSLRLPAMIRLLRIDPGVAVGSNMAIGFLTAAAAAGAALSRGGQLDWRALAIVAPATLLGGYLGARLTGTVPAAALERIIGWTVMLSGLSMVGIGLLRIIRVG